MSDIDRAVAVLDRTDTRPLGGSRSGSAVFGVELAEGAAVLKVSRRADLSEGLAPALRELDVYLTLADRLPVRTPRLIDHRADADTVVLLLEAHTPAEPAERWDRADWLALARDLAALHEVSVPAGDRWHRGSWLIERLGDPDRTGASRFWSWPGEAERLAPILHDPSALAAALQAPVACFCHGDCHAANILTDDDRLVWADWQAAGVGSPAGDLAFPAVRGAPQGAELPLGAMVAEYCTLRGLDEQELGTAVLAAELAVLVFAWPEYARFNTEAGVRRVHARVAVLADAWRRRCADAG